MAHGWCIVALEDFALYAASTIVDHCINRHNMDSDQDTRRKVRHALSSLARRKAFPIEGDGFVAKDDQAPLRAFHGWRYKQALPKYYIEEIGLVIGQDHDPHYQGLIEFMNPNAVYTGHDVLAHQHNLGAIMSAKLQARIAKHFRILPVEYNFPKEGDAKVMRPGRKFETAWLGSRWQAAIDSQTSTESESFPLAQGL